MPRCRECFYKGTRYKSLRDLASATGIVYNTLAGRLSRGYTVEDAVDLVKRSRRRIIKLHPACHPIVREIFDISLARGISIYELARRSGLDINSLARIRKGHGMSIYNIEALLNVLGLTLTCQELNADTSTPQQDQNSARSSPRYP